MNEIMSNSLLAVDKFMLEIHLRQPRFMNSVCGPFTKNTERIQNFKETGDLEYIYQNKPDKTCFQHDMAYGNLNTYLEEQFLIKCYAIKHLILLKSKTWWYQGGLASMVYKFFGKKTSCSAVTRAQSETLATQINLLLRLELC